MASAPRTRRTNRADIAKVFKTPELIKAFEALQEDALSGGVGIDEAQATADQAVLDAAAAQASANAAGAAAAVAQGTANGAAAAAAALALPSYLVLAATGTLANERALTPSADFVLVDGGAGAAAALGLNSQTVILGADVSESAGAFANVTGMLAALVANATYLVDALLTFQSAATTTGIALCFTLPAGAAISGAYSHNTTATAIEGSYNNASGAVGGNTSGAAAAAANLPITGRWVITTGATPGNAQLQQRTEVAASAVTMKAGLSVLVVRRIA